MQFIIIHVGKCSGTALKKSLITHNIKARYIHHANEINPKPIIPSDLIKENNTDKFIFCIRHPIDRFISAFNFKYTHGILKKMKDHFEGEIEGFNYFKTVNNLAENLYDENGNENEYAFKFCSKCDHIIYGLYHYLHNFDNTHNIKIIRHEHLYNDYKNIFKKDISLPNKNLQPNYISKFSSVSKTEISKKAYSNLKRFLKKDMDIIEKLAKYGCISEEYKDFCLNQIPNNIIVTN